MLQLPDTNLLSVGMSPIVGSLQLFPHNGHCGDDGMDLYLLQAVTLQEGSATNVENGAIGFFEIDDQPLSGMGGGGCCFAEHKQIPSSKMN